MDKRKRWEKSDKLFVRNMHSENALKEVFRSIYPPGGGQTNDRYLAVARSPTTTS